MEYLLRYLKLNIKRAVKLLPEMIAMCIVLVLSVALFGYVVIQKDASSDEKQKMSIALVGDTKQSYLGLGIESVAKFDSSRYAVDFLDYEDENSAEYDLKSGKITAYVVIPDNYIEKANQGIFEPFKYASCNDAGVSGGLVSEFTEVISTIISESNAAIISSGVIGNEQGLSFEEKTDEMLFRLFAIILNREDIYDVKIVGAQLGLRLIDYMILALFVFSMLLLQLSASSFFIKREDDLIKVIHARGLLVAEQIAAEYLSVALLMFVFWATLVCVIFLCVGVFSLSAFLKLLLVSMSVTAVSFFLYEINNKAVTGLMLQLMFAFIIGYCSGCLYPPTFLPEVLQKLGRFLYPSCAVRLLSTELLGTYDYFSVCVLLLTITVSLVGAGVIRNRKLI